MLKLKELREERGLYQKDIAAYLFKTVTCVCDWERGRTEPDLETLIKIADFFACTLDELVGRENYGTGLVDVKGEKLNKDEQALVESFRKMSPNCKESYLNMGKSIVNNS